MGLLDKMLGAMKYEDDDEYEDEYYDDYDDEKPAAALSFVEAYDDIERAVKAEQGRRLYEEWVERLRRETYVKVY